METKLLELFKNTFKGRDDVVAKYWKYTDKESGEIHSGYTPMCANRYSEDLCKKNKNKKFECKNCVYKDYVSLSDELLIEHFNGKYILGCYPLLKDNNCWFIAADFDNHDDEKQIYINKNPHKDLLKFYAVCEVQEIPCYALKSKSGNGYHAYIFFDKPIPAWKARIVVFHLLKEAQVIGEEIGISSFDRLFPNQDEININKPLGNLIGLPFQCNAMKNGNTVLLDPSTNFIQPFTDQIAVLSDLQRSSEDAFDAIIEKWKLEREQSSVKLVKVNNTDEQFQKLLQCDFIRWAYENQSEVKEPFWLAGISNVSRITPGGIDLCHEFSKNYPKYTFNETEMKIRNALNNSAPITCEHIKKEGFDCKKDCGVKSPIVLTYKNTKKTMEKQAREY